MAERCDDHRSLFIVSKLHIWEAFWPGAGGFPWPEAMCIIAALRGTGLAFMLTVNTCV